MKPEILLSNGQYFNFDEPDPSVITIDVIAGALSKMCRFTGHCSRFYSVAEHSVRASYLVDEDIALETLMHDATEALVADISTPLKWQLPDYQAIERRLERLVAERFELVFPLPAGVEQADLIMLAWERRDLLPKTDYRWPILEGVKQADLIMLDLASRGAAWGPDQAEGNFLRRFHELRAKRSTSPIEAAARLVEANFEGTKASVIAARIRGLEVAA